MKKIKYFAITPLHICFFIYFLILRHAASSSDKPAAQNIANSLQLYVTGSQNVFNHRSNVDTQNRVVCFDIRELGTTLRKAGMLIVQHMVWTRVSQNRSRRKSTRYYVDEFHLLLNQPQTANYSIEMWKRFRKWGGIITGISQNVTDFLGSLAVERIVGNSDFKSAQWGSEDPCGEIEYFQASDFFCK